MEVDKVVFHHGRDEVELIGIERMAEQPLAFRNDLEQRRCLGRRHLIEIGNGPPGEQDKSTKGHLLRAKRHDPTLGFPEEIRAQRKFPESRFIFGWIHGGKIPKDSPRNQ
jgi:hypothetical protein